MSIGTDFNGTLDEVQLYDGMLTSAEIDLPYTTNSAIPEPTTLGLLVAAGMGVLSVRRRRTV